MSARILNFGHSVETVLASTNVSSLRQSDIAILGLHIGCSGKEM
jgi:hypothetical protein